MVTICSARVALILLTIAAKVVDLPCPTGPTQRKKPCER